MALKIKEEKIKIGEPAKDKEMLAMFDYIHVIDSDISLHKLTKVDLKKKVSLNEFMKTHSRQSHYVFQVKKCVNPNCSYCSEHPIQSTPEQFSSLHYLLLPLLDDSKESYLPFEKVYGKEPSDKDCHSSQATSNSEAAEEDMQHKPLLKNTKVRPVIFL